MFAWISHEKKIPIEVENVQNLEVLRADVFTPGDHPQFEGFIVDGTPAGYAATILSRIRAAVAVTDYLKPVFLYSEFEIVDKYLLALADGVINAQSFPSLFVKARQIKQEAIRFKDIPADSMATAIILKVLRIMHTRKVELAPVLMPKSRFGYLYPLINANFTERDDSRMFEVLDSIDKEKLLDGRFYDRVHLCNKCASAFLNFREVCPRCKSSDMVTDDLIHHFPCGHMEAQSSFQTSGQLICPKCGKLLRHIGRDYDKPSVVHSCRQCFNTFQEPEVQGFCFYCQNVAPVENQFRRDVRVYRLSQASIHFALNGIHFSLAAFLRDKVDIVDYKEFQIMLSYELKRSKRYSQPGAVILLQISGFQELYLHFGDKKEILALEMSRIICSTLRDSDIITSFNESTFAMMLLETSLENAEMVMQRLSIRLRELIESNIKNLQVDIQAECHSLEKFAEMKLGAFSTNE